MGLPQSTGYLEAIQHPLRCFRDETLRRGQAVLDERGKPRAHLGRHADVYEIRCPAARERWAVKCFTRELPGLQRRYLALHEHLLALDVPCVVRAEYLDQGVCVRGRWFPAVKMRWIEGQRLNDFIRAFFDQPQVLLHLADRWERLALELRRAGVAHGNLQHDHVRVGRAVDGTLALHLLDYDGIFVPALESDQPEKLGHPNYQHPQRLWQKIADGDSDRFPNLVIYTALRALAIGGPQLWERFDHGDNLLFREQDFQEPGSSAVFQALWRLSDPVVHALAGRLLLACQGSPTDIPLLEEAASAKPLTPAQEEQIKGILGPEPASSLDTFSLTVDDVPAADGRPALELDEAPAVSVPAPAGPPPLPCSAAACATAIFDKDAVSEPPSVLPVEVALVPVVTVDGPEVAVYHLEAWMPEQIAVMKLQGFVRAEDGEVVESVPGLVRVHLLDRYYVPPRRRGARLRLEFGWGSCRRLRRGRGFWRSWRFTSTTRSPTPGGCSTSRYASNRAGTPTRTIRAGERIATAYSAICAAS